MNGTGNAILVLDLRGTGYAARRLADARAIDHAPDLPSTN